MGGHPTYDGSGKSSPNDKWDTRGLIYIHRTFYTRVIMFILALGYSKPRLFFLAKSIP